MSDSFGRLTPASHAAPVRAVGEGISPAPTTPTHAATVVAVLGGEPGSVLHEVRLLGQIAPLTAPAELPVGTVLEVIALRSEGGLLAALPGGVLPGTLPPGIHSAMSELATPTPAGFAPAPRSPSGAPEVRTSGLPSDLPIAVAARLRAEGVDTPAGFAAARRLIGLGVEPNGELLRGGARVEALASATLATVSGLRVSLAGAIESAVASASEPGLPPELRTPLAGFARAFGDPSLRPGELIELIARLGTLINRAVESALASDPRWIAAREGIAELHRDSGPPPALPRAPAPLAAAVLEADLGRGLTSEAKLRGLALLHRLEHKAIEEHPAHREWRPLLREILDRSNVLSYRVAIEIAEREGGVRPDPQNTWFVETPAGRPVRVRRDVRQKGAGEEPGSDEEQRFRIETRGWGLGEILVEGARRLHAGETVVGLELSAALDRTRIALAANLEQLVESFEGTGVEVKSSVVPWRTVKGDTAAPVVERTSTALDLRV